MDLAGKVIVARGPDPLTIRELRDMTESRAWNSFKTRLDLLAEDARRACVTAKDADEWRKAVGAVNALDRARHLPAIIEQELEGKRT
jgi:hypothetical protein